MLKQIAQGVLIHQSEFMQSNAIVVQGPASVLLIDPGVHDSEMACLANDIQQLGQPIVAGFSTHPHWDHLLWHPQLGTAPRYGTALCASTARVQLSGGVERVAKAAGIPERVPLDLLGLIDGLGPEETQIQWDGPRVRIVEHQAHARGHAALLLEECGVLIAGDMLSDILIPLLDFSDTADPIEDYLAGLRLIEEVASDVDVFVPGHGSVGGADQVAERLELDRAYVDGLGDSDALVDPRLGPSAYGKDFLPSVHARQLERLVQRLK